VLAGLFIAFTFIALNGFFVAAEFALVKVQATQLHTRARKGERKAVVAHAVVSRLERYLSVTQFGITLASLGLGWIGEPAVDHAVTALFLAVVGAEPGRYAKIVVTVIAFTLLTFGHVLFGELVPKLVAIQRSEAMALAVAMPLRAMYLTFRPLLWILERATALILVAMGMSADAATEGALSEEEILGILAAQASRGPSGKAKSELLERVVRFSQRTARHAMVPRVDVASLSVDVSGADAAAALRKLEFSRVLLTKGRSLDEVAGYLYSKDFLLNPESLSFPNLWTLKRDILFVPEAQGLVDVLREMQREHTPIAVVVDEYGGTSGILTMEDLLEEIVGEIRDEFDDETAEVTKVGDAEWDIDGRAKMESLRNVGVVVKEEDLGEPVGAHVVGLLGRLPRKGDKVELDGHWTAEITAVSRRRVTRVRVRARAAKVEPKEK
jgi:CBS domain containing-hemolysin-like protein